MCRRTAPTRQRAMPAQPIAIDDVVAATQDASRVVNEAEGHENEVIPQYLKLRRKIDAGAKYVITQIGFDAIAIALLGRSHPVGVMLGSLLFGFMRAGAPLMQVRAGIQHGHGGKDRHDQCPWGFDQVNRLN